MARGSIVAPLNPGMIRRQRIQALTKKPTMTPTEVQEYAKLLEAENASLKAKLALK